MIVRNWMQADPATVTSDTLLAEAKRVIAEQNLHALPVVEEGRLRGLVTRQSCLRAADFVARTQSPDEFAFFVNRLKVKDVMVRNPATVRAADTMEHCLLKGQALGVGQFPVLEDGCVVGMISATEILQLAAQFLGAWEKWSGVTLAPTELGPGVLGRIAAAVEAAGATLHALYPIGRNELPDATDRPRKRVIVRCVTRDIGAVAQALGRAGFAVLETSAEVQSPPCAPRPRAAAGAPAGRRA
ncbi:MAG: CBS domain-containing protein [Burkholderiales bacterium]|nr:CBS domain-containing protein [Burkholderiales bacterium]